MDFQSDYLGRLVHWGLDIGSTDTEAASVSLQREGLDTCMGLGIGTGLGICTRGGAR